jgi:hypothetical protein
MVANSSAFYVATPSPNTRVGGFYFNCPVSHIPGCDTTSAGKLCRQTAQPLVNCYWHRNECVVGKDLFIARGDSDTQTACANSCTQTELGIITVDFEHWWNGCWGSLSASRLQN